LPSSDGTWVKDSAMFERRYLFAHHDVSQDPLLPMDGVTPRQKVM